MLIIFVIMMLVITKILRMVFNFCGKEIIMYQPKRLPIDFGWNI